MRHAFLVTAYRDFDALCSLVNQLLELEDSYIYINIDGRSQFLITEFEKHLKKLNSQRVNLQTQKVRWGSYEHFDVYMQMSQKALANSCDYFHTITGQCRIVKSIAYFESFFQKNNHLNYIQHFKLPDEHWNGKGEPRLDRVKYYQLHDILDARRLGFTFVFLNTIFKYAQKLIGINRLKDRTYWGGIVYFSINRNAMQYLVDHWKLIKNEFKFVFCCEETVPQTILLNSPTELRQTMINFDLRYMLWETQHNENPGILDERNFACLRKEEYLFARKFDSRYSSKLEDLLKREVELDE